MSSNTVRVAEATHVHSPATKRRNKTQLEKMGNHTSIEVVEDAVRLVEDGVNKELAIDLEYKRRVESVGSRSRCAIDVTMQMQAELEALGTRLKDVRDTSAVNPELDKMLTQAFILQSKLTMKSSNQLDDADRALLTENLEEAQVIMVKLESVGDKRNDILLHALNGLANAKIAKAQGIPQRPEVISQLFNLLNENQSLEVPHSNAQVRLNHCLRISERIINQQVDPEDVRKLETLVVQLEQLQGTATATATQQGQSKKCPQEED
eukprot:m.104717 g.104717  ORF g.104717 m.104717 type:complete len:265 (-) comp27589_c0_seq2:116-910(-)